MDTTATLSPEALAELQATLFMAALTGLVELAKTTDKDHIKLRALLEIARLCRPVPAPSPDAPRGGRGRERATGFAPSPTPSMPSFPPAPPSDGTPSASAGPRAPLAPQAPRPVARARGSEGSGEDPSLSVEALLPLNRRQRKALARIEANARDRQRRQRAA